VLEEELAGSDLVVVAPREGSFMDQMQQVGADVIRAEVLRRGLELLSES
jgi:hypothetical protein